MRRLQRPAFSRGAFLQSTDLMISSGFRRRLVLLARVTGYSLQAAEDTAPDGAEIAQYLFPDFAHT